MKKLIALAAAAILAAGGTARAEESMLKLTVPTLAEAADAMKSPPSTYSMAHWWGWDGPVTKEVVDRDLKFFADKGIKWVIIEPGYNMEAEYLSPEWFALNNYAYEQAAKLGMHITQVDEAKYPSGFVNGKFSREKPALRMKAVVAGDAIQVEGGKHVALDLGPNSLGATAISATGAKQYLQTKAGKLDWNAPAGAWTVMPAVWDYRTQPTRASNLVDRGKTTANSLHDMLNKEAVQQFIDWTHEGYKKAAPGQFGEALQAIRSDEPDVSGTPYSPGIMDVFQSKKGYDAGPYLAAIIQRGAELTDEERRVKADYLDVWSEEFATHFFKMIGEWCEANGIVYTCHLNNEHNLPGLTLSTGDPLRAMRWMQMPGIDTIWNQIEPGKIANFTKLASSSAHLYGRPRVMTESFAAYDPGTPTMANAVWAINYQFARGINHIEVMFATASAGVDRQTGEPKTGMSLRGWESEPGSEKVPGYVHRMSYLLSKGRPTASVGVYYPSAGYWLADEKVDGDLNYIMQKLLENQRDFDLVSDAAIQSDMKLSGGGFTTLSGNAYKTIIVPSTPALPKGTLDRLKAFAEGGGKVLFWGAQPWMAYEKSIRMGGAPIDLSWAAKEPGGDFSAAVKGALPSADFALDKANPAIDYNHRKYADGDLYFVFNEAATKATHKATLSGKGQARIWDAWTGATKNLTATPAGDGVVTVDVELEPYGTAVIALGGS